MKHGVDEIWTYFISLQFFVFRDLGHYAGRNGRFPYTATGTGDDNPRIAQFIPRNASLITSGDTGVGIVAELFAKMASLRFRYAAACELSGSPSITVIPRFSHSGKLNDHFLFIFCFTGIADYPTQVYSEIG